MCCGEQHFLGPITARTGEEHSAELGRPVSDFHKVESRNSRQNPGSGALAPVAVKIDRLGDLVISWDA